MQFAENHDILVRKIQRRLYDNKRQMALLPENAAQVVDQSAVLVPIAPQCDNSEVPEDLCVILNKRSENVRQAGDLCCPGGGVSPVLDPFLARLLKMPFTSLTRWSFWQRYRKKAPKKADNISILYAACLRECFEEMRVNPFGVRFLGALHPQQLAIQNRFIFPMVGWIGRQKRFFPNWEVEKIVYIPLRHLLNPKNHAMFRLRLAGDDNVSGNGMLPACHPGYLHESDLLWGATYRIILDFLSIIFAFKPPEPGTLSMADWKLNTHYFNGKPKSAHL